MRLPRLQKGDGFLIFAHVLCVISLLLMLVIAYASRASGAESEIRAWTADASRREPGVCRGTTFAVRPGEHFQSWSTDWEVPAGEGKVMTHRFFDDETGEELACREVSVECYGFGGGHTLTRTSVSLCPSGEDRPDPLASGPARLDVLVPTATRGGYQDVGGRWVNRGTVVVKVRVLGELDEKWWCPEVVVEWPDETCSEQSPDCDPWVGSPEQRAKRQSWEFTHPLWPGVHHIRIELRRAGRRFAGTAVVVRVLEF